MATTTTDIFTSIRQEEEFKIERKRLLRRLLLDESKSTIERTKARVELALLTSDAHIHGEGDNDDDDAIKKKIGNLLLLNEEELHSLVGVVSRTAAERERDIERHAERHRRDEVILRLEAQLKEQGAVKSEERRQRLEKELAEAKSDMEKWEKDENIRMGEVEMDELPGVEAAKMAFSSPPRQTSNIIEDKGGNDDDVNHDSFEAQLESFRQEGEEGVSPPPPSSHHIIPASFYKSSPSLVGEEGEIIDPPPNRIIEISKSTQTAETEETSDGNASVCSHSTASTVERDNVCTRSPPSQPPVVDDEVTHPSSSSSSPPTTVSLEHQVQMLLKEAALREESMQLMAMELERSERRNEKRIAKLKNQVSKLAKENGEYPEQLQYWKQKSLAFSQKIYELEVELDEKEDEVEDLLDYKQIQDDKVELLGIEIEQLKLELRKKDRLIALDRAEECCDILMIPPKRDITRRASEPLDMDSTHSDDTGETTGLDDSFVKEEENRIDILALESKVSHFAKEKSRMEAELEEMRQLLAETNARAVEREGRDEITKKSERIIFQVSCKKCPKGKNCSVVGVTTGDLKMKMRRLTKKCVVAAAECPQKTTPSSFLGGLLNNHHHTSSAAHSAVPKNKETPSSTAASTEDGDIVKQKEVFIKHLASHIPKKMVKNEKEARSFCKKLIRVEVLKRVGGEELYWEDNV